MKELKLISIFRQAWTTCAGPGARGWGSGYISEGLTERGPINKTTFDDIENAEYSILEPLEVTQCPERVVAVHLYADNQTCSPAGPERESQTCCF